MSTVVFLHAHPDDEALLTGGTMARLAARGHRVVLVTATLGEAGLAERPAGDGLAAVRRAELLDSARILGCARVETLGYADSGDDGAMGRAVGAAFAAAALDDAAGRVAALLREEAADVLVGYDAAGGYGHPDHVQVHRVARRAAAIAPGTLLLEATVDRRSLQRALRLARRVRPGTPDFAPDRFERLYSDHAEITHRVRVGARLRQKRSAMRAHASQATAPTPGERTLAWMLRLPLPLFWLAFRREWFLDPHGARRHARGLAAFTP